MTIRDGEGQQFEPRGQGGATLIVGMILLLLMSAVSLTSLKAIRTDERMAGNLQDRFLAFQSAEAALRAGEEMLALPALPAFSAATGFYRFDDQSVPHPSDITNTSANASTYDTAKTALLLGVSWAPRFIIEEMEASFDRGTSMLMGVGYGAERRACYRITAVGFGGSLTTRVVLQSTYQR